MEDTNTTKLHVHSWFVKSRPQSSRERLPHVPHEIHGSAFGVDGDGRDDAPAFPLADGLATNVHTAGFEESAQLRRGAACSA